MKKYRYFYYPGSGNVRRTKSLVVKNKKLKMEVFIKNSDSKSWIISFVDHIGSGVTEMSKEEVVLYL